jgi:hypothetical protein
VPWVTGLLVCVAHRHISIISRSCNLQLHSGLPGPSPGRAGLSSNVALSCSMCPRALVRPLTKSAARLHRCFFAQLNLDSANAYISDMSHEAFLSRHMPRCTFSCRRNFPVYIRTTNYGMGKNIRLDRLRLYSPRRIHYRPLFHYFELESKGSCSTCDPLLRTHIRPQVGS